MFKGAALIHPNKTVDKFNESELKTFLIGIHSKPANGCIFPQMQ